MAAPATGDELTDKRRPVTGPQAAPAVGSDRVAAFISLVADKTVAYAPISVQDIWLRI
jgi:hypothetical protein